MRITDDEFQLAWKRTKRAVDRSFINPFELRLIDSSGAGWLAELKAQTEIEQYTPSSPYAIDVPKQNGAIRLGSALSIEDAHIYTFLVSKNIQLIERSLRWSANKLVFSHVIKENLDEEWIENYSQSWVKFGVESARVLEEGHNFVLFTDITAFYENINIQLLISDLTDIGIEKESLRYFSKCLNKWSYNGCDGLPQGYISSDILSNLYLNNVDHQLADLGFKFFRYGDDYRFFCKTYRDARTIQMELTRILRSRALNLQNEKTEILKPKAALEKIDGVRPFIEIVKSKILDEVTVSQLESESEYSNSYWSVWAEEDVSIAIHTVDNGFVAETFDAHFVDTTEEDLPKFKTLFRFCLNELGRLGSTHAVNQSLVFLRKYPEETRYILKYLSRVGITELVASSLLEYLSSDESIYYFQKYLILEWVFKQDTSIVRKYLQISKILAYDANSPQYLKGTCYLIIGKTGNPADLERLRTSYRDDLSESEKVKLILALTRMEKSKRNRFYGQIRVTSFIIGSAIREAKQLNL